MSTLAQAPIEPSASAASLRQDSVLKSATELTGRILLSLLFLASGLGKIGAYAGTAAYMAAAGLPSALLPLVILTEVGGAIAIMTGWKTRITAFLLAGFTLVSALVFHNNFADQIQMIMFLKNVSITGAFLMLMVNGAGRYSLDARQAR
ncbi:MAG: DoxX family protein [Paucibacter sp.]|nr:DoxX family protein [Roseateles sp.]